MRLRVRGPSGAVPITIADSSTWGELKTTISDKTGVVGDFDLKYGYPPQNLDTTSIGDDTALTDIGIKLDGEQLIVSARSLSGSLSHQSQNQQVNPDTLKPLPARRDISPPKHSPGDFPPGQSVSSGEGAAAPLSLTRKQNPSMDDPPEVPVPALEGVLVLRVMPDDNSCMFRALGSAVLGDALDSMNELRSIVAQTIQQNPELYTAGMLEKSPDDYCAWIQREDSWGGGIELSILSSYFNIEICSINVQDLRIDRFNEGQATRCVLVYSGIHYDVIALAPVSGASPEFDRKIFGVTKIDGEEEDGGALEGARELCSGLQKRHYFTDTHGFEIKCNVCGWTGKGEQGATEHAASTGHYDFGESG